MKILLSQWAKENFKPAPSTRQLRELTKTGQIKPAPVKVGRSWYVDENAKLEPVVTDTPKSFNLAGASPNVSRILQSA